MNWGNKLLVTFAVFGLGMGYLVYRSMNTNFELVEKDYYKSELRYQQVIDASNRTNELSTSVTLVQSENGITLKLPDEMKNKNISGEILFYCAYDKKKDKKFPLQVNEQAQQFFPLMSVTPGNYTVKISWTNDGKTYYSEKSMTIL